MSERIRPKPDDIEELVELINTSDTSWTVDDWSFETGASDPSQLDVSVGWMDPFKEPLDLNGRATLKGVIRDVEENHDRGAPVNVVVEVLEVDHCVSNEVANAAIDKLRTRGEVYEPEKGHLRTT